MVRYQVLDTEENLSLLEPSEEGPSKPSKRVSLFSTLIYHHRRLTVTVLLLVIAAVFAVLWRIFTTAEGLKEIASGLGNSKVDSVFDDSGWAPKHRNMQWTTQGSSQGYIYLENESFLATDVTKNETRVLAYSSWLKDKSGSPLLFKDWRFSPSMKFVLVKANIASVKRWHRSKFGDYYIYDLARNSTFPLVEPTAVPLTITAVWAPTEDSIAFVHNTDLYYSSYPFEKNDTKRVTYSGSNSFFNGVGDWIYEEEVLFEDRALWWSPDSRKIAFLSFNDSEIETYTFPTFPPPADYQGMRWHSLDVDSLHYPLPGGKNPIVQAHIFAIDSPDHIVSLSRSTEFSVDSVLFEVAWTTSDILLMKEMSRDAVRGQVLMFNLQQLLPARPQLEGDVVRQLGFEPNTSGWIECEQTIFPLPSTVLGPSAYLDIVEDREGYKHIAIFETSRSSEPYFITQGKWEVTGNILGVNEERKIVYFQAAYPTSIQRSILSANIIQKQPFLSVTPTTEDAYYRADFSPSSDYYLLSYEGPGIPWQKIMTADGDRPLYSLEDNGHLRNNIQATEEVHFLTNSYDGFDFNVKEIRPPDMDTSGKTKYPVLFTVSGAPSSQIVNLMFRRDWNTYVTHKLRCIVVMVDGRGTGYQGRNLRSPVKNRLGHWEARDVINIARAWSSRRYVDSSRVGIWGWSYGAYVALKVLEADAGVHSLVMAVAPVVNWRLYDSMFTERYLGRVEPEMYASSSVQNVSSFNRAHLLFVHGTADVNVHYDHSIHLLRMLADAGIKGFMFRSFPDADHAMRGSYRELFELMEKFLQEKWNINYS